MSFEPPKKKQKTMSLDDILQSFESLGAEEQIRLRRLLSQKNEEPSISNVNSNNPYSFVNSNNPPLFLSSNAKTRWPRTTKVSPSDRIMSHRRSLISIHLEANGLDEAIMDNEWCRRKTFLRKIAELEKMMNTGHIQRLLNKRPISNYLNDLKEDKNKHKKYDNVLRDLTRSKSLSSVLETETRMVHEQLKDYAVNTIKIAVENEDGDLIPRSRVVSLHQTVKVAPILWNDYSVLLKRISDVMNTYRELRDELLNYEDTVNNRLNNGKSVSDRIKAQTIRNKRKYKKRKEKRTNDFESQ